MLHAFSRTQLLLGKDAMDRLASSRVAVLESAASGDMYAKR